MKVSLSPELGRFVAEKVESGRYTSAAEVVSEALRLLEEYERGRYAQISAFNEELVARLEALDRGEFVHPEPARERLQQKSQAWRELNA